MIKTINHTINNNAEASRYEMSVENKLAVADYLLTDKVLTITHIGVPKGLEGRGIAKRLMDGIVADAKANKFTIVPICSYASAYMQRLRSK